MCFELGSCFGKARREDFGGERSTPKTARARRRADRRIGYYMGTNHKATAPAPTYHHQPRATAVDEAGHKAYHDGARKDHNDGYAAYVQDKQADNDTPKLSAWHNKVGEDAGYTYTACLREAAADHSENAAVDYHQYPTTTYY